MGLNMVNNFNVLPDGSLQYDKPITGNPKLWVKDPNDSCHMLPRVPECTDRKITLRTLACGRTRGEWYCEQFKKRISVKGCAECQSPTTSH
jgi:hypothetical protein